MKFKLFTTALVLVLSSACTVEVETEAYDPTGDYELIAAYGSGNCGVGGADIIKFSITDAPDGGYLFIDSNFEQITGEVVCAEECEISIVGIEDWSDPEFFPDQVGREAFDFIVKDAEATGNGQVDLSGDPGCTQKFNVIGTHN